MEDREDLTFAEAGNADVPTTSTVGQKAVAEFIGTAALVFVGIGSIAAANQAGAVGGAGLVTVAIAHGLAIATMVSAVGHISGGHFNPAVTIGALVTGKITPQNAAIYVASQLAGATVAAAMLVAALPKALRDAVELGTPLLAENISTGQGILIEAILTFFLVWVVFGTAVDSEGAFGKIAGLAIGFVVLMDIMMAGPFTGAAMNPARSFGPALVNGNWTDALVYWVGPLMGGLIAAVTYEFVMLRPRGRS